MRRHDWAYLQPGAPLALGPCAAAVRAWIEEWVMHGGPLVVTRQCVAPGRIALGAVTPARLGRARVACSADGADVVRVRGPVNVVEAASVLPPRIAGALATLQRDLAREGTPLGIYGSTAWSYFAGDGYRHAGSDVDVVCDVAATSRIHACLDALSAAAHALDDRLDGEIRFPCGRAVAWPELANARRDGLPLVLAKGARDVGMASLRELLATAA